ncbi:ABC-three component system middle component 4 [Pseudomonas sp. GB2N2]
MNETLPYILIDDDFSLNYTLLALIIYKLGLSSKKNAVLDFEKIQVFIYLTKNPSKINDVLRLAGKKFSPINSQYTYTIESLSTNVDILFDRSKLKALIKELAARGMLACDDKTDPGAIKYLLSPTGSSFVESLISPTLYEAAAKSQSTSVSQDSQTYFSSVQELIESLSALRTQTNSKLYSFLNEAFKRN